jgi:hypothetical protein
MVTAQDAHAKAAKAAAKARARERKTREQAQTSWNHSRNEILVSLAVAAGLSLFLGFPGSFYIIVLPPVAVVAALIWYYG